MVGRAEIREIRKQSRPKAAARSGNEGTKLAQMKGGLGAAQITSYANIRKRKVVVQLGLSLPVKQQAAIINMVISHAGAFELRVDSHAGPALSNFISSH